MSLGIGTPPTTSPLSLKGGKWLPHCVKRTEGAKFHPDLEVPEKAKIISKATDPEKESYSGFDGTKLKEELINRGVKRVFVGGLATDYCVKNTVFDALRLGFETILLSDAVRGVDPQESEKAIQEMLRKGAKKAKLTDIKK